MPLRTQILFMFLAITITTIAVASFFHYRTAKEAKLQEVFNHMESLSEANKLRFQALISKRKEQVLMMQIREMLSEEFLSFLQSKSSDRQLAIALTLKDTRDRIPSFQEVHLLSMTGTVEVSSSPLFNGEDFSVRECYLHALQGELCIHDFFYDAGNNLSINMAGLLTLNNENVGVLVIKTSAEDILNIINDYTGLGETGETTLAKRLGDKMLFLTPTRFHPYPNDSLIVEDSGSVAMELSLSGKEELLPNATDYRNEIVVASTRFLDETNWGLVTKIDRREALAPLRIILFQTLILALSLIAIVTIAAYFFAQRLIVPILSLRDTTRDIAIGNLEKRVSYSSRNEVGQLALNFNIMADKLVETNKLLERKIEELDRINDSLNRFAHVVSHDLKSPVHSINALLVLLRENLKNCENPNAHRLLAMAEGKAKHMLGLITGILQYSMASRSEEFREPVALKQLVEEVIQQLEVPEHIEIEVEDLPVLVTERVLILQVFQNLISNAIKYMDKPLGKIRVGCKEEADAYRLFVSDNGRGIDKRNFDKIFDIFNKTQRVPGVDSSGIGLSIVKKIIESKGGRIWVASEIGAGSTFFFTLPKGDVSPQSLD